MPKQATLIFALAASVITALGAEAPPDLADQVTLAEKDGKLLYRAYHNPLPSGSEDRVATARAQIRDWCELDYRPIIAGDPSTGSVYFLAEPPNPGDVVFGRHYKVVRENTYPSTKSCFVAPSPPPNAGAVGVFSTHLLSAAPTDFHVFLSLEHDKPIYVGTSVGNWKVQEGNIQFMGARAN